MRIFIRNAFPAVLRTAGRCGYGKGICRLRTKVLAIQSVKHAICDCGIPLTFCPTSDIGCYITIIKCAREAMLNFLIAGLSAHICNFADVTSWLGFIL